MSKPNRELALDAALQLAVTKPHWSGGEVVATAREFLEFLDLEK